MKANQTLASSPHHVALSAGRTSGRHLALLRCRKSGLSPEQPMLLDVFAPGGTL